MKKPNFFIIGAPKCGTTSMASWLAEHPQIFLAPRKEPHHFNTDAYPLTIERTLYEALFRGVDEKHRVVGEASVWYLNSSVAVSNIEKYAPGARYLVCLRNPVEMAVSLHEQHRVNGNENVAEFSEAWFLSNERMQGRAVSRWCKEPRNLAYGEVCRLGAQVQRLYRTVDRARVSAVLLDDMRVSPVSVYRAVLDFLELHDDGRREFPVRNPAKERRSMGLRRSVQVLGRAKAALGIQRSFGILNAIDQRNLRYRARPPLSPQMRRTLQDHFRDDVMLLGEILKRDLSHWVEQS